jgi:RimJ/RimL family protein N-acetyltransferase
MEGAALNWPLPERLRFKGRDVELEPMSEGHVSELWTAAQNVADSWKYLRYGPFSTESELQNWVMESSTRPDQPFWIARPVARYRAEGWLSLCDVYPADGAIEIGSIWFSPRMQKTRASTEAVFLLMTYALDVLGYKRLVWRCSAENTTSLRAARRYGFKFEGTWRSAARIKGKHVDLAWHSILAHEWPERRAAIARWLSDDNFDEGGLARTKLLLAS